jgi:predicted transcriptional regulator
LRNRNQPTSDGFPAIAEARSCCHFSRYAYEGPEHVRCNNAVVESSNRLRPIGNNTIAQTDLPKLINDVHQALVKAGEPAAPPHGEPAVPVRQSVKADHPVCLECGQRFSLLKRHLRVDHQTTPVEYRRKWGLPPTYPVVAPDYAKVRSTLAKKIGLGGYRARWCRREPSALLVEPRAPALCFE